MVLLCLCGWSNSGKDTVASLLQKHGYQQFAFANPLKDNAAWLYGFPREWADSQLYKTFYWKYAGEIKTIRQWLLTLALQQKKRHGPSIYADIIIQKIKELPKGSNVVISDLRYPEEYKRILEEFPDTLLWKVLRVGQHESPVSDPSENYHLVWRINALILNTGDDLEDLEKELLKILPLDRIQEKDELSTS